VAVPNRSPIARSSSSVSSALGEGARLMTREQFWKLVDQVKETKKPEVAVAKLLRKLTPSEIIAYQEHFDILDRQAYRWDLWGAAYIMGGGCSDDGFIDFRYGLIALGRDIYESAIKNPDSLAEQRIQGEISNELFGYAAEEAYEELTDEEDMPRLLPPKKRPKPLGEEWDFDDARQNARRLPKLWAKYGAA